MHFSNIYIYCRFRADSYGFKTVLCKLCYSILTGVWQTAPKSCFNCISYLATRYRNLRVLLQGWYVDALFQARNKSPTLTSSARNTSSRRRPATSTSTGASCAQTAAPSSAASCVPPVFTLSACQSRRRREPFIATPVRPASGLSSATSCGSNLEFIAGGLRKSCCPVSGLVSIVDSIF